jgi:hypothetical protein
MAEVEKTASEKLVNSVALTLIARVAMVVATGLILPLALVIGQRGLSTVDEISRKIDSMREAARSRRCACSLRRKAGCWRTMRHVFGSWSEVGQLLDLRAIPESLNRPGPVSG